MSERRRGLGRGLGALIPAAPQEQQPEASSSGLMTADRGVAAAKVTSLPQASAAPEAETVASAPEPVAEDSLVGGAYFAEIPIDAITPNPRQPREVFDDDALFELVTSIKEVGLLQPVVVRQVSPERYELIMGERRWRACRTVGLERVPAIVRATEDEKMLLDALLENLHRAQLNPLEEAFAYEQLLKDFDCTQEQLAERIGRSRPQVTNTLRLLRLSAKVQSRVAAGVLSAGHARALLPVEDSEEQDRLAHRIVAEGLSVRSVEEIVHLMEKTPAKASRAKGPRAGTRVSPVLNDLASRLSDRFETRVKVDLGQKKGKIVVEFASVDDLDRILGTLAPGENRVTDRIKAEAVGEEDED